MPQAAGSSRALLWQMSAHQSFIGCAGCVQLMPPSKRGCHTLEVRSDAGSARRTLDTLHCIFASFLGDVMPCPEQSCAALSLLFTGTCYESDQTALIPKISRHNSAKLVQMHAPLLRQSDSKEAAAAIFLYTHWSSQAASATFQRLFLRPKGSSTSGSACVSRLGWSVYRRACGANARSFTCRAVYTHNELFDSPTAEEEHSRHLSNR